MVNWDQYRSVMEQYVIKTDNMATEDAYFFATHMPFSQLEVIYGGLTTAIPTFMSEDSVFQNLVCNPNNLHRLIIVRGNNGTGKSHLIRYLKARLENSSTSIYDPKHEQLIFLRRLNNSVRGVFSQLLEQKVIKDPDVAEKLRKFIASSDSKDESSFKTEILYAFIAAVTNDRTGDTYKPVICRNIAQFLSDSRVQDHLLRVDGPISRCYQVITAPSDQVLKETTIFTSNDFNLPRKLARAVLDTGNPEAKDFASTIKNNEDEVAKLVKYLNRFTSNVVQRCADISSETTKSVFEQLRRDLKNQKKNLTLFIEDFTGFTGIDSELITVLSTEHGGDYDYLCRVTAIIGITDGYYDQFKDNFKDRVTHQISVTERSYGSEDFLLHMAARYLNAIYCNPEEIRSWYNDGADLPSLPINDFSVPCPWETVSIGSKEVTLYPFNKQSLLALYEGLSVKTPRMFLLDVIRGQLKEYFSGKKYGSEWAFPQRNAFGGNLQMQNAPHSSAIDRLEELSPTDKQRLKSVFALWGNGSAVGVKHTDGSIYFGGIHQSFLLDIGLSAFAGITPLQMEGGGSSVVETHTASSSAPQPLVDASPQTSQIDRVAQRRQREFTNRINDIDSWFSLGTDLQYHPDYRDWLRDFICGSAKNCGAINWQDSGIPAYIAYERLSDTSVIYIDGQSDIQASDKSIVIMNRSAESRDALRALCEQRYSGGWNFEGAAFYQQKLISWLERNKPTIIAKVCAVSDYQKRLPIAEWCLALQYLKSMILGQSVDTSSPLAAVQSLTKQVIKDSSIARETKEWNDVISFVIREEVNFASAFDLLKKSSNTTMGVISLARSNNSPVYRSDELIAAVKKLIARNWDIEAELNEISENNLLDKPAALLKKLYRKVKVIVEAEHKYIESTKAELVRQIGELKQDNILKILGAIQQLFVVFSQNSVLGYNELRIRYDASPIERADKLLKMLTKLNAADPANTVSCLEIYSGNDTKHLADFLRDLQEIERLAQREQQYAENEIRCLTGDMQIDDISVRAIKAMKVLCERLEAMEVPNAD